MWESWCTHDFSVCATFIQDIHAPSCPGLQHSNQPVKTMRHAHGVLLALPLDMLGNFWLNSSSQFNVRDFFPLSLY